MNREIKFRGKRIDNSKFVEGSLLIEKVDCPVLKVDQHGEYKQLGEVTLYSICVDGGTEDGKIWNTVDTKTVGQYTGLKDANGVEIYEGDILEFNKNVWGGNDNIHIVSWDRNEAQFSFGGGCQYSDMQHRKIIGNIHDHPELLPNE